MKLTGTITALITPFINDNFDESGFKKNIEDQILAKVSGLLIFGTTGEGSTLTNDEKIKIITTAREQIKKRVPLLVGTGSNSTKKTIEETQQAKELGADIAQIIVPYYNKPTQEGLFRHYESIAKSVNIPIVIYNIPGRTAVNLAPETLSRIVEIPTIIGIKESSGNLIQCSNCLELLRAKRPDFQFYSGDDSFALPLIALGATGLVSVISNLIPATIVELVNYSLNNDFISARKLHYQLQSLFKAAFIETNPGPIKEAMNLCGLAAGPCRLPLYEMAPENKEKLVQVLDEYQLLKPEIALRGL